MAVDPRLSLMVQTSEDWDRNRRANEAHDLDVKAANQQYQQNEQLQAGRVASQQQALDLGKIEQYTKQLEIENQLLGSATDQNTYNVARQRASQLGIDVSQIPEQFDPGFVRNAQMANLSAKDRLEAEREKLLNDANVALRQAQAGTEVAQQGTYRSQAGAYNALANERNAQARANIMNAQTNASQASQGSSGAPSPNAPTTSNGVPINLKLNEGQANANLYARRMLQANADLQKALDKGYTPKLGSETLASNPVGNYFTPEITQGVQQAQRNFINAALRRESGAVISPEEFENAQKQYFPQFGDKAETLKQKAANRRLAIEGIAQAAGPAGGAIIEQQNANYDPLGIR